MIHLMQKITITLALLLLAFLGYEAFGKNSAKPWKNFNKPQLAAFTSLEKDEEILQELNRQTRFRTYKPLDPTFFVKPTIFDVINH